VTVRAFTGPSHLHPNQLEVALEVMAGLPVLGAGDVVRTGAAPGLDTHAALRQRDAYPDARHVLVIPNAPFNRDLLDEPGFEVEEAFCEGSARDRYKHRDTELVRPATEVHAFVTSLDWYRSGTWMTINCARRLGIDPIRHLIPRYPRGNHR
jgi:hypothetical protein